MLSRPPRFAAALPADAERVAKAALLLQIREIDLFRLAWRRWYGADGPEPVIERHFVAYMFRHRVPPWVRHLCRQVIRQALAGRLDRGAFGVAELPRREPPAAVDDPFLALAGIAALAIYLVIVGLV
jgi:hypothetical protein